MTASEGLTALAVKKDDSDLTVFVASTRGSKADKNDSGALEQLRVDDM